MNHAECGMAWTHCVSDVPIRNSSYNCDVHSVAVDGHVYVFGYDTATENDGMQVLIFHPKTLTWDVVQPPSREEGRNNHGFAPVGERTYFVVSHKQRVFVCVGGHNIMSGHGIHVFDTRSCRWSCVLPMGDVPSGKLWGCTCEHDGHIYLCADYYSGARSGGSYIWDMDLSSTRWKIVAPGGWSDKYTPRSVAAHKNRIYVLLEWINTAHDTHNDDIMYFDLTYKTWQKLEPPGTKPFSNRAWIPFVHSQYLYVFLSERWVDDYEIKSRFGNRKMNEVIVRYSFASNEWGQVWFKGMTPPDRLDLACVIDNTAVFFSCDKKKVYVLDLSPSLRSMCLQAVCKYQLDSTLLPPLLKRELSMYSHHSLDMK